MSWSLAFAALFWLLGPVRTAWIIWRAVDSARLSFEPQASIEPPRPPLAELVAAEQRLAGVS